jgi:hypothetical protein
MLLYSSTSRYSVLCICTTEINVYVLSFATLSSRPSTYPSGRLHMSPTFCLSTHSCPPGVLSILHAFCLSCRPSAYSLGLLPIARAYSLSSRPTAYHPGLLPIFQAYCPLPILQTYCLSSRPTASRPIAHHPGLPPIFQAYCLTCRSGD